MTVGARRPAQSSLAFSVILLGAGALVAACEPPASERAASQSSTIVGGALDTTHKGVVSLLKQGQGGFFPGCSGTLLTQNLVLTAHHCVSSIDARDGASVKCGKTEFLQAERPSSFRVSIEANVGRDGLEPYQVSKLWVPEGGPEVCGRDIALLLLSGAGVPVGAATPIAPRLTAEVGRSELLSAIGYGLQDPGDELGQTAGRRMGVDDVQVFCTGLACNTDLVAATEWIAESPVCSGDSGGPALNGEGEVVGVTSRGDSKCTLGVYSSVYAWRDFIREKTFEAAQAGGYAPPSWAGAPRPDFVPTPAVGGASTRGISSAGSGGGSGSGSGSGSGGGGGGGEGGAPTIAAGPTAGTANRAPIIDALGSACSGDCAGAYVCWSETGRAPGICVPTCDEAKICPAEYSCNAAVGACVPAHDKESSSCSVSKPPGTSGGYGFLLGLAVVATAYGLRRRTSTPRRDASDR